MHGVVHERRVAHHNLKLLCHPGRSLILGRRRRMRACRTRPRSGVIVCLSRRAAIALGGADCLCLCRFPHSPSDVRA